MKRRPSSRRGILLLIVLSLLVLFVLIGVTFIVVATQYTSAAKAYSRHELKGDDPAKELDAALYMLLRGTRDPSDLLSRHNLLRDLYGVDGFRGLITAAVPEGGGEFLRLDFRAITPPAIARTTDYYNGSVLTLIDGQGRGHSTRIVRFMPVGNLPAAQGHLVVAAFDDLTGYNVNGAPASFLPRLGNQFVVNGKPFNGTGDGYDPSKGKLTQEFLDYQTEVALMPNTRGMPSLGDSDESWDAVDYQNYFLARIPTGVSIRDPLPYVDDPLIPSFHRPFLINYWIHYWQDPDRPNWDTPHLNDFRRHVITRPLPQDHPLFSGSNPALTAVLQSDGQWWPDVDKDTIPDIYDSDTDRDGELDDDPNDPDYLVDIPLIYGPWDVDNDGDGTPDSIWIDLGMPAKTAPDGRQYKPLYAILCVDLDGRLNVNAHGVKEFDVAGAPLDAKLLPDPKILAAAVGLPNELKVTRGQGYGPAEIRLDLDDVLGSAVMDRLIRRRYREASRSPGYPGEFDQGVDLLSYLQQWGVPGDFGRQFDDNARGSSYLTPPDLRGLGGVYLDHTGQGRYALMGVPNETEDDPYELNLLTPQASDNVFGVDELEQLLRFGDADSLALVPATADSLRSILSATLPVNATSWSELRRYTTHSFDIPTANVLAPNRSLRTLKEDPDAPDDPDQPPLLPPLPPNLTVGDMVRARLQMNGMTDGAEIERQVALIVPPQIRNGGRMDITRWLGNGRDDTTNSSAGGFDVVDEPTDVDESSNEQHWFWSDSQFKAPGRLALDDPHQGVNADNPLFSRQRYARHLYCLAMLLLDSENGDAGNVVGKPFRLESADNNVDRSKLTARRIAQWAINAVDFSDPDAIMTPFEFDLEPFDEDGWGVDDNLTADEDADGDDRAVVWGCEFPELLITETVAFHDRRVRNTDYDNATDSAADPDAEPPVPEETLKDRIRDPNAPDEEPDKDLDQYRMPQGSLFLELYCPRSRQLQTDSIAPNELYAEQAGRIKLDLGRVVNGSPVWRIAIASAPPPVLDPGDPPDWINRSEQAIKWPALAPDVDNNNFPYDFPDDAGVMARLTTDGLPDNSLILDRFIIFSRLSEVVLPDGVPDGQAEPQKYYYYRGPNRLDTRFLEPSQYAVVGPRRLTRLTSKPGDLPGAQRIVLSGDGLEHYGPDETDPNPIYRRPVLGLVCGAEPPLKWTEANRDPWLGSGIGINVSEPIPDGRYYPAPYLESDKHQPRQPGDLPSYYDPNDPDLPGLPDVPLDDAPTRPLGVADHLRTTGTHLQFRVALLQRLADPTRGYHEITNPYITVDSQTIDLTVYNGEDHSSEDPPSEWNDPVPYDPSDDPDVGLPEQFGSRERGDNTTPPLIWNPLSTPPSPFPGPLADDGEYWVHTLNHSLGYLNDVFGGNRLQNRPPPAGFEGAPPNPFPWLTWNNRPFISPLELMLVPSSPPWRLGYEFRPGGNTVERDDDYRAPFGYLLNFFHSSDTPGDGANLCRIFDYLEKPSPFVGTQKWLNPQIFNELHEKDNPPVGVFAEPRELNLWGFNVPFNRLSRFRDPGRININTVPDKDVWSAIDPDLTTSWNGADGVQQSLIGGDDSSRPERPAFYTNPVRSASSADLMPLEDLEKPPVEATLLRSSESGNRPLFDFSTGLPYADPQSNAYFRYHKLQRLDNLLTTHSNVYAIWITVGYFEVLPWNPLNPIDTTQLPFVDVAHPDGYQLGQEMGSDTGQIKRHRAFYIIDRSIPVAFEPGENHNVDRTILLRRVIE